MTISKATIVELAKTMQPSKLGRKLGMTTAEVRKILLDAGVKLRKYDPSRIGETQARSERMRALQKLYCEEKLTTKQVHERTGYNIVYLNQVANLYGWPQQENRRRLKERQILEMCKKVVAVKRSNNCGTATALEMLGINRSAVGVNQWIKRLKQKGLL